MHNVNYSESKEESQRDIPMESKSNLEADRQMPLETTNDTAKSFDEDDENSFRSDDVSRSDALSDDFQTPSASLQNLSNISQEYEMDDSGSVVDTEIAYALNKPGIDSEFRGDTQKQVIVEESESLQERKQPLFLPLFDDLERKGESTCVIPTSITCQVDVIVASASPVDSVGSISPSNISRISEFTHSTESNISRESNSSVSSGNNSSNNVKNKEVLIPQPGTYSTKPGRKKMWYHVFTPSYKTRSNDFRKNFKDLPPEERLIVDYSCAIQKEILLQGRMYISQNFVSFYANIFGWQTTLTIKFKEISTITKENTALVIPNSVQITTVSDKYFFASFVNRDSTYLMLFKLWQTALLDQNMPPKEIWKLVHECYGEVEIDSEEDEDTTDDCMALSSPGSVIVPPILSAIHSGDVTPTTLSIEQGSPNNLGFQADRVDSSGLTPTTEAVSSITNGVSGLASGGGSIELQLTDLSDSSDSEEEHVVDDSRVTPIPVCPAPHDDGKTVIDSIIPCDVNTLFTMLFTSSKFYLEFHTMRKTFDILPQEWQEKDGKTSRQVSFTVTLNQRMGPKHSQITETQILLKESKPGCFYAVDVESNNAGIPYADAFYVTCHFCLSRVAANQSRLIVIAQVRYRKSIWGLTKSFIEKNSWAGIDEFYSSLERNLKEECATTAIAVSPPPSPRGKPQVRRRALRKKGPAPGIPTGIGITAPTDADVNMPSVSLVGDRITATVDTSVFSVDNAVTLKVILAVLASLLVLNAFLYVKLVGLETTAGSNTFFSVPPTLTKDYQLSHQEWLELLQKQEVLHRFELQKWHDILLSALKVLKQAETELESLKHHIDNYSRNWIHGSTLAEKENSKRDTVSSINEQESNSGPSSVSQILPISEHAES